MQINRNETEKPNKASGGNNTFSRLADSADETSARLEEEEFCALAIARFENDGGLTLDQIAC